MSAHLAEARAQILQAALVHVPFDGWTHATLGKAVADAGLDPSLGRRAFPGGAIDLVEYFIADADRRMLAALETLDLPSMPVRERIATAVRTRLAQNLGHREAVGRAIGLLARPTNGPRALKTLYRTVDAMWHAAGDRSTDYNFYSKRVLLAGVYSATLLHWLNDSSEGQENTRAFLDRRIADVMALERAKGRAARIKRRLPDPFRLWRRMRHV